MSRILIVGSGQNKEKLAAELNKLHPHIYDELEPEKSTRMPIVYDAAFLCEGSDIAAAVRESVAHVFVIRSGVLPGFCQSLYLRTGERIIYNPTHGSGYTILGGEKSDCLRVVQLLQACYPDEHRFRITDHTTAELSEQMAHAWMATKMSFVQQFYEIAKQTRVSYEELRELFILDPKVHPAHTLVYTDSPFWESKILDYDVPLLAETYQAELLRAVVAFNEGQKEKYKKWG